MGVYFSLCLFCEAGFLLLIFAACASDMSWCYTKGLVCVLVIIVVLFFLQLYDAKISYSTWLEKEP